MPSAPPVSGDADRTYGRAFFDKQAQDSHRSSGPILRAVFDLVDCASVVDVGCGVGPWLRTVADTGIDDYLGIDGAWVPGDQLVIPAERFHAHDLTGPLDLGRRFDLAVCVEVAEHLPAGAAGTLVDTLTSLAPIVLFSAAVPDQGGDGHINEQWPGYWSELFRGRGFAAHDVIRLRLWNEPAVDWWYRQNVLLYAEMGCAPATLGPSVKEPLALVHPEMIHAILTRGPADPVASADPSGPPPPAVLSPPAAEPAEGGWIRRLTRRGGGAGR